MHESNANAYLRTRVMTASPAELRLMLLEGSLKFARQAREGLSTKNYELAFNGFTSCRAIVLELINGIRPEHDPELAERVRSLYLYIYRELFESSHEKDVGRLDKVIDLLEFEHETWDLFMKKLAGDEGTPVRHADHPGGERPPLSIQA